jgi:hypothetical protein
MNEGTKEIPLEQAWKDAQKALHSGIGVGADEPRLVESLHARTYGHLPDESERTWLKAAGLWEGAFETMTLQQREDELVGELREFVSSAYPDLMGPLGLST